MNPPALAPRQKCGLATASVVLGVAAIVLCPIGPLLAIPAVICGHMAQSKIGSSGGQLAGGGAALAGLITGYCSFAVFFMCLMLSAIAVPNFVKARSASQTSACRSNLRMINGAKSTWALEKKKIGTDEPIDFDLFGPTQYILEKPTCSAGGVYTLKRVDELPTCSIHGDINSYNRTPFTGSPRP